MGFNLPYVCSDQKAHIFTFQNLAHRAREQGLLSLLVVERVSNLAIYGHSDCELTRSLVDPASLAPEVLAHENFVTNSRSFAQHFRKMSKANCLDHWEEINRLGVIKELAQLSKQPLVQKCVESYGLKLHAWCFNSKNRALEIFDPASANFIPANGQ